MHTSVHSLVNTVQLTVHRRQQLTMFGDDDGNDYKDDNDDMMMIMIRICILLPLSHVYGHTCSFCGSS